VLGNELPQELNIARINILDPFKEMRLLSHTTGSITVS